MKLLVWNINSLVRAALECMRHAPATVPGWIAAGAAATTLPAAAAAACPTSGALPFVPANPTRVQLPTVRNAVLKYGSWLGFFQHHSLDILCLQVGGWGGSGPRPALRPEQDTLLLLLRAAPHKAAFHYSWLLLLRLLSPLAAGVQGYRGQADQGSMPG